MASKLSRAEYVAICETCFKQKFDSKKGIICSLTGNPADFEETCPEYDKDQAVIDRIRKNKQYEESALVVSGGYFSSEKKMMGSGFIGGMLMAAAGVVLLIIGLSLNRIFFYSFFLIIGGVVVMIKSLVKRARKLQRPDTSQILDDKNDLEVL